MPKKGFKKLSDLVNVLVSIWVSDWVLDTFLTLIVFGGETYSLVKRYFFSWIKSWLSQFQTGIYVVFSVLVVVLLMCEHGHFH